MPHSAILDSMFHLPLPFLEKLLRPAIVYLALVILLRIFGKRELAQLAAQVPLRTRQSWKLPRQEPVLAAAPR